VKIVAESLEQLYEVGEVSAQTYPYRKGKCEELACFYYFQTEDGDNYAVKFINLGKIHSRKEQIWSVEYSVDGPSGDTDIVNKGRFFRVISTVVEIIKEFVEENDSMVDGLDIYPSSNYKGDDRRYQIYLRYINRLLPSSWKRKKSFLDKRILLRKR
jgi:hypothetical protein